MEVFKDGDEFQISLVYNMENVQVPGFPEDYVELDKFLEYISDRSLEDTEKACNDIKGLPIENPKTASFIVEEYDSVVLSSALAISHYVVILLLIISLFKK